ncbi:hypothetical protein LJCM5343_09520 [Lactobacillus paragasseri]|uniref:Uncharacterized protein n=1 Tax=Lactobacillus paragasseri TaxID=2107999 RepID=A0ABQ0N4L5_9LACO|nr:hypothetical protein LpgJCM5343_03280 [Lactobacillus paragasseri]GBA82786.1 hypothetical protein LJCM1130_14080 [Lactobacillus paragasseri]GBA86682.1 hypothetical protein LJCM5343_09520 [Lactobacillus paragasseri]
MKEDLPDPGAPLNKNILRIIFSYSTRICSNILVKNFTIKPPIQTIKKGADRKSARLV